MHGHVLHITRFCTDDGPGVRTSVFLKGCPLRCLWCHNPESQRANIELAFHREKCADCGLCVAACARGVHAFDGKTHIVAHPERCVHCGACEKACLRAAVYLYGGMMSAEDVVNAVRRDKAFYDASGGGVTLTGGEPLFQADFTREILHRCQSEGIRTAIETSGYASEEAFASVLSACDNVLFDIKAMDDEDHRRLTGVSNAAILINLQTLDASGVPYRLRLPVIPGVNDTDAHFQAVARLMKRLKNCEGAQIMAYHALGAYKYDLLNRPYALADTPEPTDTQKAEWQKRLDFFLSSV